MNEVPHISVKELQERRKAGTAHLLLDVRETDEYAQCRIEGSTLIPLGELPARVGELPKDREIVVHCHHGGRSAQAVRFLKQNGITNATNLAGGIDAWSVEIDPKVPRY